MKKLACVVVAGLALLPLPGSAKDRAVLLIRHATIVDVANARLIRDQAVATKGDTLEKMIADTRAKVAAWDAEAAK